MLNFSTLSLEDAKRLWRARGSLFQLLCGRSIWFCSNSKSNSLLPFCLFDEFDRNWVLFNLNLETCNQKFFYLRSPRICLFRLFSTLFKLLGKWACQTAWPMCCTSPRLTRGALTSFYLFSADSYNGLCWKVGTEGNLFNVVSNLVQIFALNDC